MYKFRNAARRREGPAGRLVSFLIKDLNVELIRAVSGTTVNIPNAEATSLRTDLASHKVSCSTPKPYLDKEVRELGIPHLTALILGA